MNVISGTLKFSTQTIHASEENFHFSSPHWLPDHQEHFVEGPFSIHCTQRYIKPSATPMPYQHPESGIIIAGDFYLTHAHTDCENIAHLYLKFGTDFAKHLAGHFMIIIWDPRTETLTLAIDHTGTRSCLYAYKKDQYFIFSNTMAPFRSLCSSLTLNHILFEHFALESLPAEETCYKEVFKLQPAHTLTISSKGIHKSRYWDIRDHKEKLPCKTREDYYHAFRTCFESAVKERISSPYPIASHISGGLDSTSVAAMVAKLSTQKLYGFTAIPLGLSGPSYKKNWMHHEMHIVQSLLDQYPQIHHHAYTSKTASDCLETLRGFYPYVDMPFRNLPTLDWVLASFDYAREQTCRILLRGQKGNGTISWPGQTNLEIFKRLARKTRNICLKKNNFSRFPSYNMSFLSSQSSKKILAPNHEHIDLHHFMLINPRLAARNTSMRPLELWHGVDVLDPTNDVRLIEFCYSVPQWVFCKGNQIGERRLLVREGLEGVVPKTVRENPNRGEQISDWHRHFNAHFQHWKTQLEILPPSHFIWKMYDRNKILDAFKPVTPKMDLSQMGLISCLSAGDFWEFLNQ